MTTHKSIFYQAQEQVCEALNEDEVLSGKVTFISENSKDIDYELKNALGRQGIVGVVMTPDATYQGVTSEGEQVWDLKNFTVQVVENPIVNRGQPNYANITAHDAATRATEVLAAPAFGLFGEYCPVTIEQGEDSGLIVAQAKFDVQIKGSHDPTPEVLKQGAVMTDGFFLPLADSAFTSTTPSLGSFINYLGYTLNDIQTLTVLSSSSLNISTQSFISGGSTITIGPSVQTIISYLFTNKRPREVIFLGRTLEEVQAMPGYPWGIWDTSIIKTA